MMVVQERHQDLEELRQAMSDEGDKVKRSDNALMDCQEMLEEIQSFSEQQACRIQSLESHLEVICSVLMSRIVFSVFLHVRERRRIDKSSVKEDKRSSSCGSFTLV